MVSEVKGSSQNLIQNLGNNKSQQLQNQADSTDRNTVAQENSSSDDVKLTNTAELLKSLESTVSTQPVVDTQRVEGIKKSILDGTYNIDTKRTANKMAEFESLLADKQASE